MTDTDLTPGVLVALPTLRDPYFEKTTILLCNYNEEGAFGLVMNNPSQVQVKEVLKDEINDFPDFDVPLLIGGPVQPESFWCVHSPDFLCESSTEISDRIALSSAQDVLLAIMEGNGPQTYHLGVGYAGWGAFQLDREIQDESWWLAPLDDSLMMDMAYEERWECTLERLGLNSFTATFVKSGHV